MPTHTDVRLYFWNKQHFREVGLDPAKPARPWDELETYASRLQLTFPDGVPQRLGYFPWFGFHANGLNFFCHLWQLGGETLTPDEKRPLFHGELGIKALEWIVKMTTRVGGYGALAAAQQRTAVPRGLDVFSAGLLSQQFHGAKRSQDMRQALPELDFGVTVLPIPTGGKPSNYTGGFTIDLPKNAPHAAGAWAFMEFFMTREMQLLWADSLGSMPALKPVATSADFLKNDEVRKASVDVLPTAKWVPTIPGAGEFLDTVTPLLKSAGEGKLTPKDALAEAAAKVRPILDKNI